jgi:hypothetical protein
MRQKFLILSYIFENAPIGVVIVFVLAFIYNVNHGGIFEAIKVTIFGSIGIICAIILILYVLLTLAWEEKFHILVEWIMDRI